MSGEGRGSHSEDSQLHTMSSALSPPETSSARRSSRSPRRRKRNKSRKDGGQDDDDDSSRASSVSPSPSPAASPAQSRVPSSALAKSPLASTPQKPASSQVTNIASPLSRNIPLMDRTIEPKTPPISMLRNPLSYWARHIQPALLLAYFYARFPAVVANPVSALSTDVLVTTLLQVGWCLACLPPYSGRSNTATKTSTKSKSTPTKRTVTPSNPTNTNDNPSIPARLNTVLLSLPLTLAASVPVFVVLVLFGAPLTTHIQHTALLALHVSVLGALPLFYVHGVGVQAWWEVVGAYLASDAVAGSAAGAGIGCWLGAIPIPLDW